MLEKYKVVYKGGQDEIIEKSPDLLRQLLR